MIFCGKTLLHNIASRVPNPQPIVMIMNFKIKEIVFRTHNSQSESAIRVCFPERW